jgi:hypothetical protein
MVGWLGRMAAVLGYWMAHHRLDGVSLPSQDFVMNRVVESFCKKMAGFSLWIATRVMGMSDGTKVRGDGRVTRWTVGVCLERRRTDQSTGRVLR